MPRNKFLVCHHHCTGPLPALLVNEDPAECAYMVLHTSGSIGDWYVLEVECEQAANRTWAVSAEMPARWEGPYSHHRAVERLAGAWRAGQWR